MTDTPWITYEGPNKDDAGWWWYCECTAYSGWPSKDLTEAEGQEHGLYCDKGKYRWERDNES